MKIGILGAGTWGTALARMLCDNGHAVTLWSALPQEIEALGRTHVHPNLPGMTLPAELGLTKELSEALGGELTVFAVPSVYMRGTARAAAAFLEPGAVAVSVAKGIEPGTFRTMTAILAEEIPGIVPVALSGPTHAEEVALGLPTAIVSASGNEAAAKLVQNAFGNAYFRVYTNPDELGVELCGALKNIIALAAGVADGVGCGDNAKAAIITRGMAEIARLGLAMGADQHTFYGLAGVGDLIVTATSRHSRNNRCGNLIGRGYSRDAAVKEVGMVVEGLNALPAALGLAEKYGVEMPITQAVQEIVTQSSNPREIITRLMKREYKGE